ncbi:hypothetical protein HF086_007768 [Spodoptera exigua]|uniref:Uncharacterized protein n=1 Tax=Spodoptera exigua TaxID=7107 RepID=A0A922MLN4_SPOEX|nr:hypothetical protein HF086_007768 [Spodoptera exigua]
MVLLWARIVPRQLHYVSHLREASPQPEPSEVPRLRPAWSNRVAPTVEPSNEDVIMLVVGRARLGWVDK